VRSRRRWRAPGRSRRRRGLCSRSAVSLLVCLLVCLHIISGNITLRAEQASALSQNARTSHCLNPTRPHSLPPTPTPTPTPTPDPAPDPFCVDSSGFWQDMSVDQSDAPGWKTTAMGWGVYPEGMRKMLNYIQVCEGARGCLAWL